MIDMAFLVTAFVTLFVIIDPVGLAPVFLALTQGMSDRQRRAIALRATITGIGILALFALFGESVLAFAGISMPAFRVAGGILLFITALDMLFERRTQRRQHQGDDVAPEDDPSIFPMAIPLIAGPGAIATVILLTGQHPGIEGFVAVMGVVLVVLVLMLGLFAIAGPLERVLGPLGITVVTRLLGMLLAALAVQFVLEGLKAFGFAA